MSKKNPIPSYRRQRKKEGNDRAFTVINGERHYLGAFGSPESKDAYARIIGVWRATGDVTPSDPSLLTMTELLAQSWTRRVEEYYKNPDGAPGKGTCLQSLPLIS